MSILSWFGIGILISAMLFMTLICWAACRASGELERELEQMNAWDEVAVSKEEN